MQLGSLDLIHTSSCACLCSVYAVNPAGHVTKRILQLLNSWWHYYSFLLPSFLFSCVLKFGFFNIIATCSSWFEISYFRSCWSFITMKACVVVVFFFFFLNLHLDGKFAIYLKIVFEHKPCCMIYLYRVVVVLTILGSFWYVFLTKTCLWFFFIHVGYPNQFARTSTNLHGFWS